MTILHIALRWQRQNVYQTLNQQETHHTSPSQASYAVSVVKLIDWIIKALHCTFLCKKVLLKMLSTTELPTWSVSDELVEVFPYLNRCGMLLAAAAVNNLGKWYMQMGGIS